MKRFLPVLSLGLLSLALPQESPSYKLTEHAFTAGGHPLGGTTPVSTAYTMTLDVVGEPALGTTSSGASYRMEASFGVAYLPPGEVLGLWFLDKQSLRWTPERSTGSYNLYRDLISNLSAGGGGSCAQSGLSNEIAIDVQSVPANDGYFYLVTVENRLGEEGTKGMNSGGVERPDAGPCP